MAPAHINGLVAQFIVVNTSWLKIEMIPGGLTSVLQICDLIINKVFKQNVRDLYYTWRAQHVRSQRAIHGNGRLKIKIPRDTLIVIVEQSIRKMNQQQREKPTIRTMFRKAGQDPHFSCIDMFKQHLDSLSKDSMYRTIINRQTATVIDE